MNDMSLVLPLVKED